VKRSADFQSAVSQSFSLRGGAELTSSETFVQNWANSTKFRTKFATKSPDFDPLGQALTKGHLQP
jgi:hypothetical protein